MEYEGKHPWLLNVRGPPKIHTFIVSETNDKFNLLVDVTLSDTSRAEKLSMSIIGSCFAEIK